VKISKTRRHDVYGSLAATLHFKGLAAVHRFP